MEPPAAQNPKKQIKKASKKHPKSSAPKSGSVVRFWSQTGTPLSWRSAPKITTNPKIFEMEPRDSKRCPRAPKITENDYFYVLKSRKSHCKNDPQMQNLSKTEANKKARWRDCAQRTG